MADREVHTYTSGGSGIGILGVIIGAVLVIGAIVFFAGGINMNGKGGGGPNLTVNTPSAPKIAPSTSGSR
jgi:hypothetical protein